MARSPSDRIVEPAANAESWIDAKTHDAIPVLTHAQSLSNPQKKAQTPSMGRVLRGLVLGGRAPDAKQLEEERKAMSIGNDPVGGYTVSGVLANEWIDLLRANKDLASVLGEAFVTVYTEVKEIEHDEFMKVISPWEREHLLLHV